MKRHFDKRQEKRLMTMEKKRSKSVSAKDIEKHIQKSFNRTISEFKRISKK